MNTQNQSENLSASEEMEAIEAELKEVYRVTPSSVRTTVYDVIRRTSAEFTDQFYDVVINQPGAHFFLDHQLVNERLHRAMKEWLDDLFKRDGIEAKSFIRRQQQVGWVHARIKVPERLVSRGFRELKRNIIISLRGTRLSREDLSAAIYFVSALLDLGFDVMTCAYIDRSERSVRSDEAFRLFSLGQNLVTERERQRASLSEWAQSFFFTLQVGTSPLTFVPISQSDFGLWVFHRAILLFDRSSEYERLIDAIKNVEQISELVTFSPPQQRIDYLRKIKAAIGEINSLLALLFDNSLEAQGARDTLTQLLNRKFVNTVISAEITAQKVSTHPFSVLMIEIDRFDQLRSRLGETGGDIIVQRTAQLIFDSTRTSDSVFSMGRETFLVVYVEANLLAAKQLAKFITDRYATTHFSVNGETVLDCSLSVGVVEYDGHPDPRELVNRAQRVLLEEKKIKRDTPHSNP
ncbi:putative ggdef family protein [Afipia carboxidovorans OM5]|uniref:Diguanylate cyclase DosC n=1 Tax=Afipia carboxidovorans (strain ATCC 49405 / DSM 1227 / KCTC 32145 / OM5) TaxID=504832 RepID=B6JHB4_AFIC5|nr:GGDEF domain-containing protein [Afipia carboxidovorans]ACI93923.1 putative ggdef family protein [Afipia carboxidovorans OM5]AEI02403.1 diguanylate cyclase YddV [Afipia carboxidovorans OM4]AEI05979.1 diguanylate cyclase YddV [Afipia carboxidovorans OM5]